MQSKHWFICFVITALLSSQVAFGSDGFNAQVNTSTTNEIELEFNLENYSVDTIKKNGRTFSTINHNGTVTTMKKGFAALPFIHASVMLPEDGDVAVSVSPGSYVDIQLTAPLLPSKGVLYRNQNPDEIPYRISGKSLVNTWYPGALAKADSPYIFRDIRGTNVYAYPFQYNARQMTLRVYETINVTVNIDSGNSVNPLTRLSRSIPREMNSIYQDMFINYSASTRSGAISESGDILVAHTSRDVTAIQPYLAWKRQKGFTVETLQVATGTNIKDTIADYYSTHPALLYVQIVGDWADIKSDLGTSGNAPMDPMLGCVEGSDSYPDLIIGRFSANSVSDVSVQVNKAISYEKNPPLSGSWYTSGLGIASGEGSGNGDDGEADFEHMDIIKDNRLLPFGYSTVHEVYKSGSASTVSGYLNSGLGLINYAGHGSHSSWATSGFSTSNISSLTNGQMLPVIISVACVNGEFHTGSDCFAEGWLKKEGGGAVATVMSTINQPWQPPMRGQDYMNDLLTGGYNYSTQPGNGTSTTEGRTTFGSIVFNGLILMYSESSGSSDLETIQTWTIFGDASLQVRTEAPRVLVISNTVIEAGTPYTTTVTSGGTPVEGAAVTIQHNGTTFKTATNSSGQATLNHGITSGDVILVISGNNLETKYYEMTVGNPVNKPPVADFSFEATGLTVSFTDASTDTDGTVVSQMWDFGDGNGTGDLNPVHSYTAAGTYTVILTVTDDDGATGEISRDVTVKTDDVVEIHDGDTITDLSGAKGDWLYFKITPPTGSAQLTLTISGGSGDTDLYTKSGEKPTLSLYDCRPYLNGNNETCVTSNPTGTYYIGLYGYSSFSGVSLSASCTTENLLVNGVPATGIAAASGNWVYYMIDIPAGASNLSFVISDGSGDADLYTRFNEPPTSSDYDCRPYISGNNETCTVNSPSEGRYHIGIKAYNTFSGVTLTASHD